MPLDPSARPGSYEIVAAIGPDGMGESTGRGTQGSSGKSRWRFCGPALPAIKQWGRKYLRDQPGRHDKAKHVCEPRPGRAYTPLSTDPDGKIYAENEDHLLGIGN